MASIPYLERSKVPKVYVIKNDFVPRLFKISPTVAYTKQNEMTYLVVVVSDSGKGNEMDFIYSNHWKNLYFFLMRWDR